MNKNDATTVYFVKVNNHTVKPHQKLSTAAGCVLSIVFLFFSAADGYGRANASAASGRAAEVAIHHIIDGDSLVVRYQERDLEIRLWGIDAPEYDQPGSTFAKQQLIDLTSSGTAVITIKDKDRYGRTVVMLECDGVNINEALVASGSAWVHVYYCRETPCERWKRLEREARKNHLGLWQWEYPIEPWKWKSKR